MPDETLKELMDCIKHLADNDDFLNKEEINSSLDYIQFLTNKYFDQISYSTN